MEEKIYAQLTKETLYDFLLYHTYSKFSGFLSNVLGMAVAFMGIILLVLRKITWVHLLIYLIAAVVFVAYTPIQLKYRAKKQMEVNGQYKYPSEYIFSVDGIRVLSQETETNYEWEKIQKAVVTPKNVGIYWKKDWALIIPKSAFGERFVPVMQMITEQIGRENVRLR